MNFFSTLFDPTGFPPRWQCGAWTPAHGWLHILSDFGIWAAYCVIPGVLGYYAVRRPGFPFRGVLFLFVVFILLCGLTHLMEAAIFWWPAYRLAGALKVMTAVVSWAAVVALVFVTPRVMAFRSPAVLEAEIARRKAAEEQTVASLHDSERRYQLLLEGVPQLVWTSRPDGWCDYLSRQWVEYTGVPEADQLGYGWSAAVHPDDRAAMLARWEGCVRTGQPLDIEFRIRSGAGEYRWFQTHAVRYDQADGSETWFGTNTDIHDRKLAEEQLRELNADLEGRVAERTAELGASEERFRRAFESAPIGIALVAPDGRWLRVNRAVCGITGYTEPELLATDFQTLTHPDDLDADLGHVRRLLAGEISTYQLEKRYFHKDGHVVRALLSVSLVRDDAGTPLYFISQVKDITERKRAEQHVLDSLREKEVLLKEIHHRVKNNLQIVSTLLDLQSGYTRDPAALEMFKESRGRVKSMALIHERLYRSQDMAQVDVAEYVRQLADDLYRTYKVSDDDIRLELDIDIPPLTIDIAIPCGLILNELMSNCFKHAFAGAAEGCVRVSLRRDPGGANLLTVADDGAGLPAGTDFRTTTSFGLQLVSTLAEQLDGDIELAAGRGTTVTVRFPRHPGASTGQEAPP